MEEYLQTGIIISPFKLDGTVKVKSTTFNADLRYQTGNKVFLTKGDSKLTLTIERFRSSGSYDYLTFKEYHSIEEITPLVGYSIMVVKSQSDLKEGQYFFSDLIGCNVVNQKNENVGIVKDIKEYPAQITLEVLYKSKVYQIPFVKSFINKVDINLKTIFVNMIEGMLWK